jgi:hypothetical protein
VRIHQWIAHVLLTTTKIRIPSGFFFNSRALDAVSDGFGSLVIQLAFRFLIASALADQT